MADILIREIGHRIEGRQKLIIKLLQQDFRGGTADHVRLASGIAAYCALDDLAADLTRESKQGQSAAEEIRKNASDSGAST